MNDLLITLGIKKPISKCEELIQIFKTVSELKHESNFELCNGITRNNLNEKLLFNTLVYECKLKHNEIGLYNYYFLNDSNLQLSLCKLDNTWSQFEIIHHEYDLRSYRAATYKWTGKLLSNKE